MSVQHENIPVFDMHVDVCALAAHTTSCPTRSASRSPFRACGSKRWDSTVNNEKSRNPWPGNRWPATSSSLVCSRDLPAPHRSVLCPLGIPLTPSMKQCYDATLNVKSPATEYERTPNYVYNKHQIISKRFPLSNKLVFS